jgi:hypothetical protein
MLFGGLACFTVAAQSCADSYNPTCVNNPLLKCGSPPNMPCNVHISHNGGAVKLKQDNGNPADTICVVGKTVINWYEDDLNSSFTVTLTNPHSGLLFSDGRKQFAGRKDASGSVSDSDKVADTSGGNKPQACNKYTVAHCKYGDEGDCPKLDPKVIVNGGGGGPPHMKK